MARPEVLGVIAVGGGRRFGEILATLRTGLAERASPFGLTEATVAEAATAFARASNVGLVYVDAAAVRSAGDGACALERVLRDVPSVWLVDDDTGAGFEFAFAHGATECVSLTDLAGSAHAAARLAEAGVIARARWRAAPAPADGSLTLAERRLHAAISACDAGVCEYAIPVDDSLYVSPRCAQLIGYEPERLPTGWNIAGWLADRVHPDDRPRLHRDHAQFVAGGAPRLSVEFRLRHRGGHWVWLRGFAQATERDARGRAVRVAAMVMDTTATKETEARLELEIAEREQAAEQLRDLALHLTAVEQKEREQIAHRLHDHFQQLLVAAKFQLTLACRVSGSEIPAQAAERMGEAMRLIDESIQAARTLSVELVPPELNELGLPGAFRVLGQRFGEQYGLNVEVSGSTQADLLSRDVRSFVYQAVSEMLLNVVKHGKTSQAWVTVEDSRDMLVVTVADDGVGCASLEEDEADVLEPSPGFGLANIRQRLTLLGGRFDLEYAPAGGFRVTLAVPKESKRASAISKRLSAVLG